MEECVMWDVEWQQMPEYDRLLEALLLEAQDPSFMPMLEMED